MKLVAFLTMIFFGLTVKAQELQLHYDFRHSLDPANNRSNYPTLFFQYFKTLDSGSLFIKPGSFMMKMQTDFKGKDNNQGNFYMQVSQSFRCWKPKIFIHLEYSGGLGIAEPGSYGYYITNSFSAGLSHLCSWKGGYYNFALDYRYNAFERPSHDAMISFYWWKGLLNYKIEISGDVELWTVNKNRGDAGSSSLKGKLVLMFGEPQVWYNLNQHFALGTRINIYFHIYDIANQIQVYPSPGLKYKF